MAFSTAVAAGTVATMRGYRGAPYVWALGLPLALLSGYLRIAADRHYVSDVLVGAALGSAFGALTPWLMHRVRAR
jgi:membrane-associated phospholipid phosphatase